MKTTAFALHQLVRSGDLRRVRERLDAGGRPETADVNAYDGHGYSPLMHAAMSPKADVEMVRLLLRHGADFLQESRDRFLPSREVVRLALAGGDPQKVVALVEAGADIHYRDSDGYDAMLDAAHGRDALRDPRLIGLLNLLITSGVALSGISAYSESALRVLSRIGRFDAVRLLLASGADADHLQWSSLVRAVALGSVKDVETELASGTPLEERDWWGRTAWLVAIQTGDMAKASLLLDRGANADARGRCDKPPLFYAIENTHTPMLRWLLEIGQGVGQADQFGTTALMDAVEFGNAEAVDILLLAGADVNFEQPHEQTALRNAQSREIVTRLLDAGADPRHLTTEGRRALLGFDPDPDEDLLDVSPNEYRDGRTRRFGVRNPERMDDPFWQGMIRAGINGYQANQLFDGPSSCGGTPVWCAQRFGQTITLLPDGRIVQIAGEHEDSYDPDFCIYNDVFVHDPDGTIRIYGYPEADFPPTDFHTATLIGDYIYVIGSLGYPGARRYAETQVFRLDTRTLRMERLAPRGESPGWIYRHRALISAPNEICITGGMVVTPGGGKAAHDENEKSFVLDTMQLVWRAG